MIQSIRLANNNNLFSIFRTLRWSNGISKEVLERNFNEVFDNTLKMIEEESDPDDNEVMRPEQVYIAALILTEKHQGDLYEVLNTEIMDKAKEVIKRYIKNLK